VDGKQLLKLARDTFNLADDADITPMQLNYVMTMIKPTNYLLEHHQIKGKPVTYSIPDYDLSRAIQHRPWQVDILNDLSKDVVIIKARQLGLSEVGISQIIYWLDTHSFANVKGMYTFPTYNALQTFYKTRILPEFEGSPYYNSLVDMKHGVSQSQMKIRNSTLIFRSSGQASSTEGVDIDYLSLDEYDRQLK
jgi:hypothetical protein